MSIYRTKTMLAAINQMLPSHTFLRDTFFGKQETILTEVAEVDVKKGKRRMAPFVSPRAGGVVVERDGFSTKQIKTPKIAPKRILTIDNISNRGLGEGVYSTKTPDERAQEMLANDLVELDDSIVRREEWMCREVLLTGKVTIAEETNGKKVESEVNYGFANKKTPTTKWNVDGCTVFADLKAWRKHIIEKTGKAPDICIMASDVIDALYQNPEIEQLFNAQRLNVGTITPKVISPAVTFVGELTALGIQIYTYDEWFVDDKGTSTAMIPEKTVVLASRDLGKRIYGAVTQMEEGGFVTYEGIRVPKKYADEKNNIQELTLTSRPLPVPGDVESWVVATVL